jgi:periplasmic protein TonB
MDLKDCLEYCSENLMKLIGLGPRAMGARLDDPYNIYRDTDDPEDRRALRTALFAAILFHLALFAVRFTTGSTIHVVENSRLTALWSLPALSPTVAGGSRIEAPGRSERPEPKPQPVAFPDPTPDEPEPLYETVLEPVPQIMAPIASELSIGDIIGPPRPAGHSLNSPQPGAVSGLDGRSPIYVVADEIQAPVPLYNPPPLYTEEARRARVEGVVWLQAIIRRDGTVDGFKVIRGLGYGLDESAIQAIAAKWRFKPGSRNGEPVDVQVTIEVSFRLY